MMTELRPSGTVERECAICKWVSWHDPLSKEATAIPYICVACHTNPVIGFKCTACNRHSQKPHRELVAEYNEYATHCADCKDVPYRTFAKVVYCWCPKSGAETPGEGCPKVATQTKAWPKHCDCPACWQEFYHVCDEHAAGWIYDLPPEKQIEVLRSRGVKIRELPDGSYAIGE